MATLWFGATPATAWAPMWAAVFADVGVSMLCILNAMHLLWGGKKEH